MTDHLVTSCSHPPAGRARAAPSADVAVSSLRIERGEVTVACRGELDRSNRSQLRAWLDDARRTGPDRVVVDFGEVSFFDGATIGVLASTHADWAASGLDLAVRSLSPFGRRIFGVLELDFLVEELPRAAPRRSASDERAADPQQDVP